MRYVARLKRLWELADLSASDLARLCGVPRVYFSQAERLGSDPSFSRIVAASVVLGFSLDWFARGPDEEGPSKQEILAAVERARAHPEATKRAIKQALGIHREASLLRARSQRPDLHKARPRRALRPSPTSQPGAPS